MRAFVQNRRRPSLDLTRSNTPSSLAVTAVSHLPGERGNQAMLRRLRLKLHEPTARSFIDDSTRQALPCKGVDDMSVNPAERSAADIYEHEAERLSDQVMRSPGSQPVRARVTGRAGQAKRIKSHASGSVPPVVLDALSSPGEPLDATTRAFMERRLAHDFGRVRIHANDKAAESARAVSASAYTVGRNVVFAAGQYAPENAQGRRLLAHELVHVMQQEGATSLHEASLQRQPAPPGQKDYWIAKDIPANLHPHTADDALTMMVIHYRFRQAVLLRHDFQTALELGLGGRRFQKSVSWESDLAQGAGGSGSKAPDLAVLAREHQKFKSDAKSDIASLQNADLAKVLSEGLDVLFPDIGFSPQTGRSLQVLAGPKSVLDRIELGAEGASLVRLLRRPHPYNAYYW
jgi:hypothetical protein